MITSALLILAAANAARAQSTASLFPVGFEGDGLRGDAIGTGAAGTTYRLSGTFAGLDVPYTMTLVEDSTHVSIAADIETAGITVPIDVQCAMGGGDAVCRQVIGSGIDATTFTESGAVVLTGVPIGGAGGSATASGTRSTSPSITFSSSSPATATGGGGTELPPSLSSLLTGSLAFSTAASGGPAATGLGSSDSPFGAGGNTGSGALKNGIVMLGGFVVPAVLAFLNAF